MRCGLGFMILHALDFSLKRGDPLVEFAQRIPIQAFPGEERGAIAT